MTKIRIAIYGAGVGGLSVAHELSKFSDWFDVHVYEASDFVGGKARSQYLVGTGRHGRDDLPGEHGFRFFPAFYTHLDQTLAEIPTSDGRSVQENLVGSDRFAVARNGRSPTFARRRIGAGFEGVSGATDMLSTYLSDGVLDLSPADLSNLVYSIVRFMLASETRRREQYDFLSWYDFTNSSARVFSDNYRALTCSLPRTMVAMDGRYGSAYTIGKVCAQLFFLDPLRRDAGVDRVLNAPTNESWLDPWYRHLVASGVHFHFGQPLERLSLRQCGLEVEAGHLCGGARVDADYHVCAIPLDKMVNVVDDDLAGASTSLRLVRDRLAKETAWMVGAQYFLDRELPIVDGHVAYVDSPWALTSVSQQQFWRRSLRELPRDYGDGRVRDVLSVDISNWTAVAPRLGRAAMYCTREEILDETFRQLQDGLNGGTEQILRSGDVVCRHLDHNIVFDPHTGRVSENTTPLTVHSPGTFRFRPDACTELSNLFVASDYVATHTNLASMEGANEAARRVVHGVFACVGLKESAPVVRQLPEPAAFAPFRRLDEWAMKRSTAAGHPLDLDETELSEVVAGAAPNERRAFSRGLRRAIGTGRRPGASRRVPRLGAKRTSCALRRLSSGLSRAERRARRRTFLLSGKKK